MGQKQTTPEQFREIINKEHELLKLVVYTYGDILDENEKDVFLEVIDNLSGGPTKEDNIEVCYIKITQHVDCYKALNPDVIIDKEKFIEDVIEKLKKHFHYLDKNMMIVWR